MAIKAAHREILDLVFNEPFEQNAALTALRAEIVAQTSTKAERKATLRNETDDPEVREAVKISADIASQIAALQEQRDQIEAGIDERVDLLLKDFAPNESLEEDRKRFAAGRKELVAALAAAKTVAPRLVGSAQIVEDYLTEIGFEEVPASIRGGSHGSTGKSGLKRPRLSFVSVDGNVLEPSNLTAAVAYIKKAYGVTTTSQDIQAAYTESEAKPLGEHEATWTFALPGLSDGKSKVVTISTKPREATLDVETDDDEDDED